MSGEKYIFFLDIDGTLYTDGIICERNRRAIERARANGHRVFLNTGRAIGIIPPVVNELVCDGSVTSLGSNIIADGKLFYSNTISEEELIEAYRRTDGRGARILYEGNDCVIVNEKNADTEYDAIVTHSAEEFARVINGRVIPKIFVPGTLPEDEREYFSAKYTFCQHPTYAEISPKGDTKATGMRRVTDYYLPEKYVTVAMGDSLNDIDMLTAADVAVAMGDAHEKIKPLCGLITVPANEGGVAQAIYEITGIREEE